MIYFIQCGGLGNPIKIGSATHVEMRMASLQCASPYELKVLGTQKGEIELERHLHERFKADRIRGEWFKPSTELLGYISRVNPYRMYTTPFVLPKGVKPGRWDHFLEALSSNDEARILDAHTWLKQANHLVRGIVLMRIKDLGLSVTLDPKPPGPPRPPRRPNLTPEQQAAEKESAREYLALLRKDRRKYLLYK